MPDLLRVKQQSVELVPGSYVRIKTKSSKYAGDLAQVDNVDEDGHMPGYALCRESITVAKRTLSLPMATFEEQMPSRSDRPRDYSVKQKQRITPPE